MDAAAAVLPSTLTWAYFLCRQKRKRAGDGAGNEPKKVKTSETSARRPAKKRGLQAQPFA